MSDEQSFYAPDRKPAAPRTAKPGLGAWRLRNGDRVMTCELRDDDRAGAGFDVQLIETGELRASRRCVNVDGSKNLRKSPHSTDRSVNRACWGHAGVTLRSPLSAA